MVQRLPPSLAYCLPVLDGDRLRFSPWRPGDALVTNRYGIPEPDVAASPALEAREMSMVVLPLVGFGMLAYVLALASAFTSILAPGSAIDGMQMLLVGPVMLFELVFGLWLSIRSVDVPLAEAPTDRWALPTVADGSWSPRSC